MKLTRLIAAAAVFAAIVSCSEAPSSAPAAEVAASGVCIANDNIRVTIGQDGSLVELVNLNTGQNYASGALLWRLYYDSKAEKEIEICGDVQSQTGTAGHC